ncbi:MAG: lysylphosphatidylglycerol synthase domain-containing protein [bacterium]|nr:lysylphosphatidylglycerol synthase domain-containing protein [bacterium]
MASKGTTNSKIRPAIKNIIATFVIIVITYFMANQLYRGWKDIPFASLHINYIWLIVSYLGLFATFCCSIKAWQIILKGLGTKMSFTKSWWVITGSFLAKYIPGHVWAVGGRMILCKAEGIPEKISGTAMVIEMMVLLLGSLLAAIICIPFLLLKGIPSWVWLLTIPTGLLMALLFSPMVIVLLRWVAKVFLKREVALSVDYAKIRMASVIYLFSAIIQGTAFYLLIRTVYPISIIYLPGVIGLYNGAWAVGFLSLITPSGLGVREGALVFLLKYYIPVPLAVIISILARLWFIVFEVVVAFIGLTFRKQ